MAERIKSVRWVFDCFSWKPIHPELLVLFSAVQAEEKDRIGKFVFMKDAKSSLVGRLLMRKYIHNSLSVQWNDIKILRDVNGKPYYNNEHFPISFNISHQGRYVVLAGESSSTKIGIDVMEREYRGGKPIPAFFRLMRSNFSFDEWKTITNFNNEKDQVHMFYRYWCLKESYVKAIGVGITIDLKDIVFKINTTMLKNGEYVKDTELWVGGVIQMQWEFHESLLDHNYCCCVALYKGSGLINTITKFKFVTIDDILEDCKEVNPPDPKFCSEFLKKE
ncbi:L-aminoadipate-semialdehyde dehydrogenase-phosphopantetheinyl transferase [Halyomorpha halys]|uniref:L-aminoadipate-semialdehyde dehydrogenase-phosphopantetheinyl transferase n=1 Tax=Halyomorpha halys TaxID=286706 RepID=UPI000D0C8463|nr:L-aminoadipate-semialdehyde dehydrogenase-phosphopantetheinyl transferase [Halyomorpha halys]